MSFHTGVSETILFNGWIVTNWHGVAWSMVGIALLTCIYEGLKNYREHLYTQTAFLRKRNGKGSRTKLMLSEAHILQTIIHGIQMTVGYLLMLVFMTYNIWLCLAVILGGILGYWLFSWEKSNGENTDCCF